MTFLVIIKIPQFCMGNEINQGYKIGSVVLGREMNDFSA